MLGHFQMQDESCPGCGHPKAESFAVGNDWEYRGISVECHACAAMRRAEKRASDSQALYSFAVKRGDPA